MSWAIANEIRGCGGKPEVRATKEADVSVRIGEKRICFEVETGDNINSYGPEHVREKMAAIRRNCDKLIVLVTKRELRGKYANLYGAETITRTEVQEAVRLLFK